MTLYVGKNVFTLNSTFALINKLSLDATSFSSAWCVVAYVMAAPPCASESRIARAKAAPSVGSVPLPTSSNRTSDSGDVSSKIDLIRLT